MLIVGITFASQEIVHGGIVELVGGLEPLVAGSLILVNIAIMRAELVVLATSTGHTFDVFDPRVLHALSYTLLIRHLRDESFRYMRSFRKEPIIQPHMPLNIHS